jgi:galactoside O-acetyltransferase
MKTNLRKILWLVIREPFYWLDDIILYFPGHGGQLIRKVWMRQRLAYLGKSPIFETGIAVTGGENIQIGNCFSMMRHCSMYCHGGMLKIGDRVSVNQNVLLGAADGGSIIIGNDVLIGPNVVFRASNHVFRDNDRPIRQQGHTGGRIVVENDVWIGANVVVLPNVTIGEHSVIAAGAVITNDVEPWTIAGGVPAQTIGRR